MEHAKRLAIGLLVLAVFLALFFGLLHLALNFYAARVYWFCEDGSREPVVRDQPNHCPAQ